MLTAACGSGLGPQGHPWSRVGGCGQEAAFHPVAGGSRTWGRAAIGRCPPIPVSVSSRVSVTLPARHTELGSVTRARAGGHVGALPVADRLEACCAGSVQWFPVGGNGATRGPARRLGEAVQGAGWTGLAPGARWPCGLPQARGECCDASCSLGHVLRASVWAEPGRPRGFLPGRAVSPGRGQDGREGSARASGLGRSGGRPCPPRLSHSTLCCSEKRAESHKYARFPAAAPGPPPARRWQGPAGPSCPEVRASSTLWGPDWGKEQSGRGLGDPGFLLWGTLPISLLRSRAPHPPPTSAAPTSADIGVPPGSWQWLHPRLPTFQPLPLRGRDPPVPADGGVRSGRYRPAHRQSPAPMDCCPTWPGSFLPLSPASRSLDAPGVPGVGTSARAASSGVTVSSVPGLGAARPQRTWEAGGLSPFYRRVN